MLSWISCAASNGVFSPINTAPAPRPTRAGHARGADELGACPADLRTRRAARLPAADRPAISAADRARHHADRHALIYWRRDSPQSWIGYEDDVHSGISPGFGPYEVTDADVHAVAAKGGALDDFARLDRGRK